MPAKKRKRALRRIPDLDQVVDITIELLEKHGESGFRIEDLMERTGISKSSLYLRFGSRDGLLATAYSKVFKTQVMESISGLSAIISRARTPEELRTGLHAATAFVASPERLKQRLERAAIIAGVRGRPEFRKALGAAQRELTDSVSELFEIAAQRSAVHPGTHARPDHRRDRRTPVRTVTQRLDQSGQRPHRPHDVRRPGK